MAITIFPDRMTPEETAHVLGVTSGTLSVWRSTKRYSLPYIKIGHKVFYRGRDIESFIESRVHCKEDN